MTQHIAFIGAGETTMASQSEDSAATLRQKVTSLGGTTEQAIQSFNNGGFKTLVADAMVACADHSRVLAKQLGDN